MFFADFYEFEKEEEIAISFEESECFASKGKVPARFSTNEERQTKNGALWDSTFNVVWAASETTKEGLCSSVWQEELGPVNNKILKI